jgi:hypothetical protein
VCSDTKRNLEGILVQLGEYFDGSVFFRKAKTIYPVCATGLRYAPTGQNHTLQTALLSRGLGRVLVRWAIARQLVFLKILVRA